MKGKNSIYEVNLRRVVWESVLTSIGAGFSCATITIFWNSIGMNQAAIGFVQMIYTMVVLFLDIPMGYVADRFSRKMLNIMGDIGVAFTFLLYALSQNMYMAILAESLLGIFTAMTNGVDQAFLKHNADAMDPSGRLFEKVTARTHTYRYLMSLVVMVLGGFVARYSLRLTIALSFIPYFIGGLIAFKIKDTSEKADDKNSSIIKGMIETVKSVLKDASARTYMICYILGKEVTHAQIWVFTPMMIMVGVPIEIISIGWVLNQIMQIIGGKIAEFKMIKFKTSMRFLVPMAIQFTWLILLIVHTNIFTIWLFALNGFVRGLADATLVTPLQIATDKKIQTSVMSMASTGARLMYIPMVYFTNYLGNIKLQLALVGVVAVYFPISTIVYFLLRKMEIANKDGGK